MNHSGSKPSKTADEIAEEIRQAARDAPPIKSEHEQSMRAIVRRVANELEAMRKKGYNMKALAEFLGKQGVSIAAPTLATYLRNFREEKAEAEPGARPEGEGTP